MFDISKIDSNFAKTNAEACKNLVFYSAEEVPFSLHGLLYENGCFRRMPQKIAQSISEGVHILHTNTAGGRLRFCTNSPVLAISTEMDGLAKMSHMAFTGSIGFDLYANGNYNASLVPPGNLETGYSAIAQNLSPNLTEYTLNFPLYSNVKKLYIGIQKGALLQAPAAYRNKKPVVFYGSSITQGGCASRPGTCYQSILSREFLFDYLNLGFSGNAMAEDRMIEYLQSLEMSAFVCDYDHNAPTPEHLQNTHQKLFSAIRQKNTNLPIVLLSRPVYRLSPEEQLRREIIFTTYKNATALGDRNIYFLDGPTLMQLCRSDGTVDGCHPTDFGFAAMAAALRPIFEKITAHSADFN